MSKNIIETFENKSVAIDGTEFLTIINRRAETEEYLPVLKDDIENINKTKEVNLDNIQELFTYLVCSEENYKHYYAGLKRLIADDICPTSAVEIIDNEIDEDEKMFSFLEEYFDYEVTIDGMVKIYLDNEEMGEDYE